MHLVEFVYNNGHQETLGMSPFESLYGRKCRTPIEWDDPFNRVVIGLDMLKEMEQQMVKIRYNLKTAQGRHKRYIDLKRTHKEFEVEDHVYLRVNPKKSSLKIKSFAKLEPRYSCGPFKVLDRIGPIAYRISFPTNMRAHNVFHVSLLKKYVHDPNHVVDWNVIQVEHV